MSKRTKVTVYETIAEDGLEAVLITFCKNGDETPVELPVPSAVALLDALKRFLERRDTRTPV